MTGHVDPTKQAFAAFRANDRLGPIHMLNLVRFRDRAAYPDGREATGAEAYASYGRESHPVFSRLGGRIVWRVVRRDRREQSQLYFVYGRLPGPSWRTQVTPAERLEPGCYDVSSYGGGIDFGTEFEILQDRTVRRKPH